MAEIDEVQFPTGISKGSSGGPVRRTSITELGNGFEERNTPLADSIHKYDAGLGLRSLDDLHDVKEFFEARMGQLYGFRWKDWGDYKSCKPKGMPNSGDQTIAVSNGGHQVYKITKTYESGLRSYTRRINKPVENTVTLAVDGALQVEGADFFLDYAFGVLAFGRVLDAGQVITVGFEFDVPVRFDIDSLNVSVESFNVGACPNIEIVELKMGEPSDTSGIEISALGAYLSGIDINTSVNIHWAETWS